jgi:hypothetical protein
MTTSKKPRQSLPQPTRLHMPEAYNISQIAYKSPRWELISKKIRDSKYYWIGTVQPDNHPHIVPVWGIWFEDVFYFITRRETKKAHNLFTNPHMVVHLESGLYVVIVHGIASEVRNLELLKSVTTAYSDKYADDHFLIDIKAVFALVPTLAFTWLAKDYRATATCWKFS